MNMKSSSPAKKNYWFYIIIAFVTGVFATLLIVFAVNSSSDNTENLNLVSSYEQFGFQEFNAEELESQPGYLAMLSMNAERKCLVVMLDNDILYEKAIIDYFEDILRQIPKGQYKSDVSQIESMIEHHRAMLEQTLQEQEVTRSAIDQMDDLIEKYLK